MKILFVATEMAPLFKVGGLGDVIGSLPMALSQMGLEISVVLPFYKEINRKEFKVQNSKFKIEFEFGEQTELVEVYQTEYKGVMVYFLRNRQYITEYDKVAFAGDQK